MSLAKSILLSVFAMGLSGCGARLAVESADTGSPRIEAVRTRVAAFKDRAVFYESTGAIKARLNATLSSRVMARVLSVLANEGDAVSKGQTLATLDSRDLAADVQSARANLGASNVGVANARTARDMEVRTSAARIAQAEAALQQSRAATGAAKSRLDLAMAGPRTQERAQAHLAVVEAESTLTLARTQLDRARTLLAEGAVAKKDLDEAQNIYDLARARRDAALEAENMSREGSRSEDIRTAQQALAQAQAAEKQAQANLEQAHASALQSRVKEEEIRTAQAQVGQSSAALQSAEVSLSNATIQAPFDGKIVARSVDPGAMASPGAPLMLVEGGDLRLEAIVPEGVLQYVRRGATVRVRIDALDQEFTTRVDEIAPQGDASSHTFVVKLVLPASSVVRSGMFGRAYVQTGSTKSLEIPESAVWEREGLHYAFVVNAEEVARLRIVTVGEARDGQITILSGLSAGERFVVEGRDRIRDGDKVVAR